MAVSNRAPEPEGPEEVRRKFAALNRPRPWDLLGQAGRLPGKLDLKVGTTVLLIAEGLNFLVRDMVEALTSVPSAGWITAIALPVILAFFHRKQKEKEQNPTAAGKLPDVASTPEAVSAAVTESRKSLWQKALDKARPLDRPVDGSD